MADDLNKLRQDLDQVSKAAENATNRINELQRELGELVSQAATGGKPVQSAVDKLTGGLVAGTREAKGGAVLGGGAGVNLNAIQPAVTKLVNEINRIAFEAKYINIKRELLETIAGRTGTITTPITGIISGITASKSTPTAQQATSAMSEREISAAIAAEAKVLNAGSELSKRGLTPEQVKAVLVEVEKLKVEWNTIKATVKDVGDEYRKLTISLMAGKEKVGGLSRLITPTGDVVEKVPKAILPSIDEQLEKITKDFGRNFSTKLKDEIDRSQQLFRNIGIDRAFDEITVSAPKRLADGVIEFTSSINKGMAVVDKYTIYIDQLGRAYNKLEYEQRQLYSMPQLAQSLGETQTKRALNLAGRHGFGIEQLKDVYTQEPTGISVMKFAAEDAAGVMQKLEVTVDRYGNVLTRTNRRLLGFTDAIVRNTQEVLKWSIGVGLVYGSIYKLQELFRVAIDNETKLADITVTLGDAQRDVNEVFDEAAKVAAETGESINDVLETYSLSYRAVGSIQDPAERTNVAIQLLTDSTVLNKLSSLDAASSIDVLAGSLRQLQKPGEDAAQTFARGRDLLDSWIQVSRRANVDLASLATAFSITSESAENSGVSVEQLNAIIASLAEKIGGLGGRETGNAVRALIGGVYQQQAAEILTKYGIAVQDTAGKMRPFLDISREIYTLYREGIISADELNKIGYTLGGGVRRGQQYVAFLSDFERIQELVNEQTDRGGATQEALGRKIDTTQTSITRLANAFQNLAQTLGTDGGVLDSFSGLLNLATQLVNVLDRVTETLGGLTIPASVLAISAMFFAGQKGQLRTEFMSGSVGGKIAGMTTGLLGVLPRYQQTDTVMRGGKNVEVRMPSQEAEGIGRTIGLAAGKYVYSSFIGLLPAIGKALTGDLEGAAASAGGAILGALISGGNPLGAIIGAAVAETFIEVVKNNEPEFKDLFDKLLEDAVEEAGKTRTKDYGKMSIEEQQKNLIDSFYQLNYGIGSTGGPAGAGFSASLESWMRRTFLGEDTTKEDLLLKWLTEEQRQQVLALGKETVPVTVGEDITKTSQIEGDRLILLKQQQSLVNDIIQSSTTDLRSQRARGEISPKEYIEALKTIQGIDAALSKLQIAYGDAFDEIDTTIKGTDETYRAFADILINSTGEQRTELVQFAQEWIDLEAAIAKAKETQQENIVYKGETALVSDLEKQRDELEKLGSEYSKVLRQEQLLGKTKLPSVISLEDIIDLQGFETLMSRVSELEAEYFRRGIEEGFLTEATAQIMKDRAEPFFIKLGGDLGYQLVKGITDSSLVTQAFEDVKNDISTMGLGFQTFDVTREQMAAIEPQYQNLVQKLTSLGYSLDEQKQISIFKDGVIEPMTKDWKIVQYLLQQILETEKKQLDGIYNLPEGAGFYVPYQTLNLAYQKGLNEAGGGTVTNPMVTATGQETTVEQIKPVSALEGLTPYKDYDIAISGEISKALLRELTTVGKYDNIPEKKSDIDITELYKAFKTRDEIVTETPQETIWDTIKDLFGDAYKNIIERGGAGFGLGTGTDIIPSSEKVDFRSLFESLGNKLSTTLNLNVNSTTTLLVDGRVLAEVVKNYLHEDMVRYENTGGAINRVVSI